MMANIIEYLYSLMQILELLIVIFVPAIAISIPIWYFLIYSLEERKLEIANEFSDDAIDQYYRFIYQNNRNTDKSQLRKTFEDLYYKRFGKQKYVIPYLLLISLITIISIMIALSATSYLIADPLSQYLRPWPDLAALISNLITGPSSQYILPWPALAALSGAYVWLLNDFIAKARYRDVAPSDLLWGAARLVACVPLGYAVGVIANKEIMPFLAFGLGAFPTDMMAKLIRRLVESQLKIDKSDEGALDPISQLQGMLRPIVERFNSEGIFSVTKLAYSDPVLLAMRTSYSFNFVVDCVSQSLVWIYLETQAAVIRQFSLRGAYEIWEFVKELDSANIVTKSKANKRLEAIAKATQIDIVLLEFSLRKISDDEYTIFISKIWTSVFKEEVEIKADIAPPRGQLDSWAHYREPDL